VVRVNRALLLSQWGFLGGKKCYGNTGFEERPRTANSALAVCNNQIFSAVHKIVTILTSSVVSVCERSFSALRRRKLWNQCRKSYYANQVSFRSRDM